MIASEGVPSRPLGDGTVRASWIGTAVFTLTSVASVVASGLRPVGVVSALVWFGLGCVAFVWAFAIALERSRTEELSVAGIWFMSGSSPTAVRWHLLGSFAVQTVVAFATAAIRPFTSLAFGILVPMYGLGLAGLWAARHGTFPPRRDSRTTENRAP